MEAGFVVCCRKAYESLVIELMRFFLMRMGNIKDFSCVLNFKLIFDKKFNMRYYNDIKIISLRRRGLFFGGGGDYENGIQ